MRLHLFLLASILTKKLESPTCLGEDCSSSVESDSVLPNLSCVSDFYSFYSYLVQRISLISSSFQEIIAIACSWCKSAYHNKISCFMMQQIEEPCNLGALSGIVIPPTWIVKLPTKRQVGFWTVLSRISIRSMYM